MKIPTKVKVGGHMIDVIITSNSDFVANNEIGKTYLAKNAIYLNANYPITRQEEALLHELIHNCFYDMGEEQNESLIERLGGAFYMIIQDNPEIFK